MIINAPNVTEVPEIPPNISQGLILLAKKLLPAKLSVKDAAGSKNGHVFNSWVIAKGLRLSAMTAEAIAAEFYKAAQSDCEQPLPQLVWQTPPKALLKRLEQNKPTQVGDNREASNFEKKAHEADVALEAQKIQDEAKKRCQELASNFAPCNHRRGTLNFSLRDEKQTEWRKKISESKDFVKLEREILQEQKKLYEAAEKAAERMR